MVEITLPIILQIVQTVGILVGIIYYITIMRNQQRTRELTLESQELARKAQEQALETRKVQLFMQIYQDMNSTENLRIYSELINMEWEDWDDFRRKYGSKNNPESYVLRYSMWVRLNGVGLLVKDGHIDVGSVHDLMRQTILTQWEKWGDIIIRIREEYNMVGFCDGFEFLANEMVKEIERRGQSADVPESIGRNVPKEKEDT
jgi:hypothetical protein